MADDAISSVMAPVGVHLRGFDVAEGFDYLDFDGQEDKDGWMVCQNIDADWQNRISAINVQYIRPQPVKGRWIRMGEGEHSHSYFSGFFTSVDTLPKTVM